MSCVYRFLFAVFMASDAAQLDWVTILAIDCSRVQVSSSMRLIMPSDILMIRVLALYQNGKVSQLTGLLFTHAFYSDKRLKMLLCTLLVSEAVGKIVMISTILPEEHGTCISFAGFSPHLTCWQQS